MNAHDSPDFDALPLSVRKAIDQLCDRFALALEKGESPRIEQYLNRVPELHRSSLFGELLRVDKQHCLQHGKAFDVEEYCARFPNDVELIKRVLHEDQPALLDTPSQPNGAGVANKVAKSESPQPKGLHIRCPHCHNPIEIVMDTPVSSLTCEACGSDFSLLGEKQTKEASTLRNVAHFELIERLGMGGFATVWKARDTVLDRTVAVKIPRHGQLGPDEEVEKFLREARAAAQLKHPNIVSVQQVGRHEDTIYIVSDLVRGVTLSDWCTARQPTFIESAELCARVAAALHHAHEAGVVHRDLKPQNIMMDDQGEPHIMDFGLAKREAGEITMTIEGQILGTPAYMSPEQACGDAHLADQRTDVYAIGVVLFELLTGELPFRGNARMLIYQVINDDPPRPRKLNAAIPVDVETICLKCLEKQPNQRYATAEELASELRCFAQGKPIQARPISRVGRCWRWCRRNPLGTAAAGLSLFVVAALIIIPWIYTRKLTIAEGKALHQAATATLDKALDLCEKGRISDGLLWLSRGLKTAQQTHADDLEEAYRWNLGAWSRQLHTLALLLPHPESVYTAAYSPDGQIIATGCEDGKLRLWDANSGDLIGQPLDNSSAVLALEFHPDGEHIFACCRDGQIRSWTISDGHLEISIRYLVAAGPEIMIPDMALSPKGDIVAIARIGKQVGVWDTQSGEPVTSLHSLQAEPFPYAASVEFSPDGRGVLVGFGQHSSACALYIDIDTKKPVFRTSPNWMTTTVEFSPDGSKFVTAATEGQTAQICNASSGELALPELQHDGTVRSVAFSSDGELIATGSDDAFARIWTARNGRLAGPPVGHGSVVRSVRFRPSKSQFLPVASEFAYVWDLMAGSRRDSLSHDDTVMSLAFSPNSEKLAVGLFYGATEKLRIWDLAEFPPLATSVPDPGGWVSDVKFSPDGNVLFVADARPGIIRYWDLESSEWKGQTSSSHGDEVWAIDLSPDGKRLISGGYDYQPRPGGQSARLWDVAKGDPLGKVMQHMGKVLGVAFSPNGKTVLTGSHDQTIRLWDAITGQPLGPSIPHGDAVLTVAFSPDGTKIATGGQNRTAQQWNANTWDPIGLPLSHEAAVSELVFSPDGNLILTASHDNTARIWHAKTSRPIGRVFEHEDHVTALAISLHGRTIATGSSDRFVHLWNSPKSIDASVNWIDSWIKRITGKRLDDNGIIQSLEFNAWKMALEVINGDL